MAQLLEDSLFCEEFIQQCPAAVEVLNLVAQECSAGKYLLLSFLLFVSRFVSTLTVWNGVLTVSTYTSNSWALDTAPTRLTFILNLQM